MEFLRSCSARFFSSRRIKRRVHVEKGEFSFATRPLATSDPGPFTLERKPHYPAPASHSYCCPEKPPLLLLTRSFVQTASRGWVARKPSLPSQLEADTSSLFFFLNGNNSRMQPAELRKLKWRCEHAQKISQSLRLPVVSPSLPVSFSDAGVAESSEFGFRDDKSP